MRSRTLYGVRGLVVMLNLVLLVNVAPFVAATVGNASTSQEFFSLLGRPGIRTIYLNNDISLMSDDAPEQPVNLTSNLSIVAAQPAPRVASLAVNYITSKIRLQPYITLTFERIILSGILRGTGQHLDLLTRSDGGSVLYNQTINHRHACLPFQLAYKQLQSLPPPQAAVGAPLYGNGTPMGLERNMWLQNRSFCWLDMAARNVCMSPFLDMIVYGTYNQIIDGVLGNGGYNSFFVQSYGVCDKEISQECINQMNADLCLAAAVAPDTPDGSAAAAAAGGGPSPTVSLAVGLGVGLGGALLLAVVLAAVFARAHWRHRREAASVTATPSARSKAGLGVPSQGILSGEDDDMERGSGGGAGDLAVAKLRNGGSGAAGTAGVSGGAGGSGTSEPRLAVDSAVVVAAGRRDGAASSGRDGKGGLGAAATAGSTGSSGTGSNSSSSGVTIEASSVTMVPRGHGNGDGSAAAAGGGLGEVEAARLNLLANAAKGRAGRSAPLDVKVLQLLGQGSFGKVYKGIWHGTVVALKAQVLPPSLSGDARRRHMAVMEVAISSAINHPSIVQTYCYSFRPIRSTVSRTVIKHGRKSFPIKEEPEEPGAEEGAGDWDGGEGAQDGGEDYGHELLLVLEYCDGGSLRAALDRGIFHQGRPWPWDWRRVIQAAGQQAQGAGQQQQPQPTDWAAAGQQPQQQQQPPAAAAARPTSEQQQMGDSTAIAAAVAALAQCGPGSAPPASAAAVAGGPATVDRKLSGGVSSNGGSVSGVKGPVAAAPGAAPVAAAPPPPPTPPGRGAAERRVDVMDEGRRSTRHDRTIGASELASSLWPKLDMYEPDFTHGAFEVILPADDDDAAAATARGEKAESKATPGGADGGAAVAAVVDGMPPAPSNATLTVVNTLAGAPTAASSFVSSFSNAVGAGASAADNAAAAAAADRLAMMYLLQQAAAAVAAGADPAVGGYAKMLADYISSSQLMGLAGSSMLGDLAGQSAGLATAAGGGGGGSGLHSSDTLIAPPPAVLAAAAAAVTTGAAAAAPPPPPPPLVMPARSGPPSGSSALRSVGSLPPAASSGAPSADVGALLTSPPSAAQPQQPPPAIRYGLMLAVASDVAGGLLHLHAHGVVHGDVKASNVLLKQIVISDPMEAAGRVLESNMNHNAAAAGGGGGGGGAGGAGGTGPSSAGTAAASPAGVTAAAAAICGGVSAADLQRVASAESMDKAPRLGLCAKVSDFGLSTMLSASNMDTHVSATTAAGSLSHMSPELLLCGHVSKANDVYAFGVLLFELLTGERAWEGMPRALLPARVALEGWRPVFPPHTPPAYRQLAERCWLADPAKRPTFEDIVSTLRDMRDAAAAEQQPEWVPVPNPQLAFLHQLALQRRPTGVGPLASPSERPQSHPYPHSLAALAAGAPAPLPQAPQATVSVEVSPAPPSQSQ